MNDELYIDGFGRFALKNVVRVTREPADDLFTVHLRDGFKVLADQLDIDKMHTAGLAYTIPTTLGVAVVEADNLAALRDALQACEDEAENARNEGECDEGEPTDSRHGYDLADLPIYGGDTPPGDTLGVYSWDASRLLVADGSRWEVVEREPTRPAGKWRATDQQPRTD